MCRVFNEIENKIKLVLLTKHDVSKIDIDLLIGHKKLQMIIDLLI